MKFGLHLRNSGPHATRDMLRDCARTADATAGIDDLWVFDHIAIPPDQAEGSGGRYIDPLVTLAFIAGITERISIGTKVLILPYRPTLPTAKWVAGIQELSNGRMLFGVGVGWMEEEFRALGVDRSRRGEITDDALEIIHRCFASDDVEINGQRFLFRPRPARPPIYVGGAELRNLFLEAGKPEPEILVQLRSSVDGIAGLKDRIGALGDIGVTRIAINAAHERVDEFREIAERVARLAQFTS